MGPARSGWGGAEAGACPGEENLQENAESFVQTSGQQQKLFLNMLPFRKGRQSQGEVANRSPKLLIVIDKETFY